MRIGWTACGLLWCLSVVTASSGIGRPSSSNAQHRRLVQRQAGLDTSQLGEEGVSTSPSTEASLGTSPPAISSPTPSSSARTTLPPPPSTPPSAPPSPAPTPMDLTVSYSLSNDCLLFISTFHSSSLFKSCLPFSLLLTTSTSFRSIVELAANNSYSDLNELISYTNSPLPSAGACDDYFAGLTKSFGEKKHCAADLGGGGEIRNPAAVDVRNGLGNYKVMREAAGLVDPDGGEYCYLQAVADSGPDDMYLWSLPTNIPVPRTAKPTCSKCSGLLLNHFSSSLSSPSALNSTIIRSAADTVNAACGGTFIAYNNAALANSASNPTSTLRTHVTLLAGLAALVVGL